MMIVCPYNFKCMECDKKGTEQCPINTETPKTEWATNNLKGEN